MNIVEKLNKIRHFGGQAQTQGIDDETLCRFAETDRNLRQAVVDAREVFSALREENPDLLRLDEAEQMRVVQGSFVNFYPEDGVCPYVAIAARGPWMVTSKGAVLYDCGGYGMLGLGHAPQKILATMNQNHVMANVMTPNFSQLKLAEALQREVGKNRKDGCPFTKFVCVNSGSESVTVGARFSDINAKRMTDPGGRHAGKEIRFISLENGFHGRTDRPSQFSDSCLERYTDTLASFRDRPKNLYTVAPNDIDGLKEIFAHADANNVFIESLFCEPVMGEGNPGLSLTPEFYATARQLTKDHGALLLIDSIQAGLRAQGVLSIVDYPGFENLEPPDMETYSKALNAGQYPLSILALTDFAAEIYEKGVYGNTMTANPRAMDVACEVLDNLSTELRENIVLRGKEAVEKFSQLADELDGPITKVQGTGLLFSVELDDSYKCYGAQSTEEYMRFKGINVIHGGTNSLRFTPYFHISSEEIDLLVDSTRDALLNGPRRRDSESVANDRRIA
ncbi:MAG: aminotransferase class III-fold pyridoxal phosphate-dependent enzyme [Pseudomonadota bacterium]